MEKRYIVSLGWNCKIAFKKVEDAISMVKLLAEGERSEESYVGNKYLHHASDEQYEADILQRQYYSSEEIETLRAAAELKLAA